MADLFERPMIAWTAEDEGRAATLFYAPDR